LVNSGFEAIKPQLVIPLRLAEELGLWPTSDAKEEDYGTAGGRKRFFVVPDALKVCVITEELKSYEVTSDAVISDIEEEVLISDKLGGKLAIAIEDLGEGLWRLKSDKREKVRKSEEPQLWG
jgi:hypothetical protein